MKRLFLALAFTGLLGITHAGRAAAHETGQAGPAPASAAIAKAPFATRVVAQFHEPWAMTFLADGRALVTEKNGKLRLLGTDGMSTEVAGVRRVDYGGQGGLGDVVLHPDFDTNHWVYLSFVEAGPADTRGAALARGKLDLSDDAKPRIDGLKVIWRQVPKFEGRGHYSHRIAFAPDGKLFLSSGERQQFDPAQDMKSNAGKILRLNDDGSVPADNPFHDQGGVAAQVWTLGHRNVLGLAFDAGGQLWNHEMGPKGGDEFNRVERGSNYGYPIVSNGDHYDGRDIPDHPTHPEFAAPAVFWSPVISPAGLVFYRGDGFRDWKGNALVGALSGQALVRLTFDGERAREAARYEMGARIREVEQAPDGRLYVLEDEKDGSGGRLLELVPASAGSGARQSTREIER